MTEETQAATAEATTDTPAPAKAAPKPRAPKLVAKINGKEHALLKYPFPVKAQKFPIKVNGVAVDAATTGGRGNSYTYFVVNGTSFYIAGALDIDAEVAIDFPESYEFATTGERKSYYKPKKGVKVVDAATGEQVEAEGTVAVAVADDDNDPSTPAPGSADVDVKPTAKAKRRGK